MIYCLFGLGPFLRNRPDSSLGNSPVIFNSVVDVSSTGYQFPDKNLFLLSLSYFFYPLQVHWIFIYGINCYDKNESN